MKIPIKNLITDTISGEWGEEATGVDDVRIIRTTNFTNGGEINFNNIVVRKIDPLKVQRKKLINGDIIIEKSGGSPTQPVGRVVFFDTDNADNYLCNNFTAILRPDSQKVYPKFLFYQLLSAHQRGRTLRYQNKTTGIINLKLEKYLDEFIDVPSLSDQIKIATVLSKAEALIRQRKESIDLLNELGKSTFLKMYIKVSNNTKKYTLNALKSAGNGTFSNGPFGSDLLTSELTNEGVPVIYIRDIRNGYFERSNEVFVTQQKAESLPNCKVEGNDLLIAKVGDPPGVSAIYPSTLSPAIITQDVIRIRLNKKIANPCWINFYLNSIVGQRLIKRITITGTRNRFSLTNFKQLELNIPPIKLQNQFEAIVEKTEVLKAHFQNNLTDLENLYASLSQRSFKGELDLSAVTIDETLLAPEINKEPLPLIPADLQKAIELASKISKQFEGINNVTKLTAGFIRQLEQWGKLQDQFKNITKMPDALILAQKSVAGIQEVISKAEVASARIGQGFNWETLSNRIKERYKNLHFSFEMLQGFIQKENLAHAAPYYASEELKANPRLNEAEDFKSFIQSAIQNVAMDEKQQRQTNPFLRLTQLFYNAEEENFTLSLHKDDFKLVRDKTPSLRSGIYFSIATEA